jgi:hypothetical protein
MNNIYKQLETIIEYGIRSNPLPYKNGNSIRIGKVVIRHSNKHGYIVYDCELNKPIETAHSLRGALAIAKLCDKQKNLSSIKTLDKKYSKYYNDSIFYRSSLKNANDDFRKNVIQDRLEIAEDQMMAVVKSLEDIIFDNK